LDSILLITNVTDNIIIYNFADPTKGGTVSDNVLTLTYDTSSMSNTDKLLIFYDDSTYVEPVSLPTATVTTLTTTCGNNRICHKCKATCRWSYVAVNNFPTEYPLSAAQVSTLTPPAAITGFATSAKQLADGHSVAINAGTNQIGDVGIAPRTTGGWSVGNFTSGDTYTALTNGAQVIKASAGKFGGTTSTILTHQPLM